MTWSTKHQPQPSGGSYPSITGWPLDLKCFVACRRGESSQHPTCPHVRHSRRCTQATPSLRHSSQPLALGCTLLMLDKCTQLLLIVLRSPMVDKAEATFRNF